MIRKLRFKLISAAMISLFIVITIIIGIVNILNYHGIVQDADGILTILQDNNGRFPQQNTQTDITKQSPEATAPVFSPDGPGSESDSIENASGVTQAEPPKGNNNPRLQSPELPYRHRQNCRCKQFRSRRVCERDLTVRQENRLFQCLSLSSDRNRQ